MGLADGVPQEMYSDARPMQRFQHDVDDALSQLRYTYLKQLHPLLVKRRTLKAQESKIRKQRDAQFPRSIEEYHNIPERSIRLRIARFLQHSTTEQEKMMDQYVWSSRAVQPLLSAFKTNASILLCARRLILTQLVCRKSSKVRYWSWSRMPKDLQILGAVDELHVSRNCKTVFFCIRGTS